MRDHDPERIQFALALLEEVERRATSPVVPPPGPLDSESRALQHRLDMARRESAVELLSSARRQQATSNLGEILKSL